MHTFDNLTPEHAGTEYGKRLVWVAYFVIPTLCTLSFQPGVIICNVIQLCPRRIIHLIDTNFISWMIECHRNTLPTAAYRLCEYRTQIRMSSEAGDCNRLIIPYHIYHSGLYQFKGVIQSKKSWQMIYVFLKQVQASPPQMLEFWELPWASFLSVSSSASSSCLFVIVEGKITRIELQNFPPGKTKSCPLSSPFI